MKVFSFIAVTILFSTALSKEAFSQDGNLELGAWQFVEVGESVRKLTFNSASYFAPAAVFMRSAESSWEWMRLEDANIVLSCLSSPKVSLVPTGGELSYGINLFLLKSGSYVPGAKDGDGVPDNFYTVDGAMPFADRTDASVSIAMYSNSVKAGSDNHLPLEVDDGIFDDDVFASFRLDDDIWKVINAAWFSGVKMSNKEGVFVNIVATTRQVSQVSVIFRPFPDQEFTDKLLKCYFQDEPHPLK